MPTDDLDHRNERRVSVFRNGRNQAVRIPKDFELDASEAILRKEGDRLVIEPIRRKTGLSEILRSLKPLDEGLPDIDGELLPVEEVQL